MAKGPGRRHSQTTHAAKLVLLLLMIMYLTNYCLVCHKSLCKQTLVAT